MAWASRRLAGYRPGGFEFLEPRRLLTSNVVISEFMAINNSGLGGMTDSFGDKSDWIEIHNNGVSPVDLAGWKLTNGTSTWTFPSSPTWTNSVLAASSYMTVYASGEDTVTLGGTQLHTNFKLSGSGDYLALLHPDSSVAYEYAPSYPAQIGDVSYGITESTSTTTFLTQGAASRLLIPTNSSQLPANWNSNGFDASASPWFNGTTGVGFEPVNGVLNETEPNGTTATANNAATNFVSVAATQYQLTWTGSAGTTDDWYKIGAMQAGDVLTVTGSGSGSISGNASDLDIQLWRAGSGSAVKTDADNGPGNDPLIDHFTVATTDTYYVEIKRKTSTSGGNYSVNVWLDNVSAAPTTGGSFAAEAESNDTLATANDASSSWRVVGFKSRTVGTITASDIDVYKYQFTAGDEVSINVTASGGLDAQCSLKNSGGSTLVKEDGTSTPNGAVTANSSIYSFKITSTGTYYVQVQSSASTTGSYTADAFLSTATPPSGAITLGNLINTNIQSSMLGINASAFVRIPFNVTDPTAFNTLDLRMKYNDGYVAYLNGVEVARRNAGGTPGTPLAWNATATATRDNSQAIVFEDVDLTSYLSSLVIGANVLAIQGLNVSAADTNFLELAELDAGQDTITATTFYSPPTPGAVNANPVTGQVATPTADKPRGFYNSAFYVTLAETTPGAQVRYTLNGSAPTATTGTVYAGPISITQTSTLRFAAFKSGMVDSTNDTETYLFLGAGGAGNHPLGTVLGQPAAPAGYPTNWVATSGASTPADYGMDSTVEDNPLYSGTYDTAAALKSLPTLSLVGDPKAIFGDGTAAGGGIYSNPTGDGVAFEAPVSVEWIEPPSADNPNGIGDTLFQTNAGLRIHGGASRNLPTSSTGTDQHSLRILFKSTYGVSTLDEPIFQDAFDSSDAVTSFNTLALRGTYNNSWTHWDATQRARATYTRDEWDRDVMNAMGDQTGHGLYIQVYINGMYWGLYNLEEFPVASFAASYFGGNADTDWDAINGSSDRDGSGKLPPTDGTTTFWYSMMDFLHTHDMTSADSYAGMQRYLNVTEFADYMIDQMWAGNNDWPQHNWYAAAHVDRTDPLNPVAVAGGQFRFFAWDSEHILESTGQDMTNLSSTTFNDTPGEIYTKLKTNPEFQMLWADRVHKFMFNNGILTSAKAAKLFYDNLALVDKAVVAESARWGDVRTPGVPYTRNNEYITEVNRLLGSTYNPNTPNVLPAGSYFAGRNATVLAQFRSAANLLYPATGPTGSDAPEFNIQDGDSFAPGFIPQIINPFANTGSDKIYYTLDGSDPRLAGGAISPTAIDASVTPIPALSATTHIIARRLNGTVWSASNDITIVANPNLNLKITELNYNPYAPTGGSFTAQDFEFVELQNTGATTLNLNGFKFTNGVTFTFPNMTLPAGGYTVVVSNLAAFQSRYGTGPVVAGAYTGHFDNGGEEVALEDPLGSVLQDFTYDDSGDWPGRADGAGSALDIVSTAGDYNDPANWRSSVEYGGSPGAAGLGSYNDVVVNEVLANSAMPQSDTIELFNPTVAALDISGWWLSDTSANLEKYRIPNGTVLGAGQYIVFNESQFNAASPPPGDVAFTLSPLGGDAWLMATDVGGNLVRFADHAKFDASAVNVSLGRWPNGTGSFLPLTSPTFAGTPGVSSATGANASPAVGQPIITEVDYNPGSPNDDREFVEIGNPTGAAIDISGWQLAGDVDFVFPAGTIVPAGSSIVVLHFDPNHPNNASLVSGFRSFYGIGSGVPLYGPYSSVLDNSGGTVKLERPVAPVGGITPFVLVDQATFDDLPPWPSSADGSGQSLNRRRADVFGGDSSSWLAAAPTPGTIALDITAPTVAIPPVVPNPRNTPVSSLSIQFSEAVTGFDLADLSLTVDGGANLLSGGQTLTSSDGGVTWTLGNLSGLTAAAGAYSLTLTAAGSGISDPSGNALAVGASTSWTVDLTAPTVNIAPVAPNPRSTALGSLSIQFSEAVTGFDLADLSLTRDGGGNLLSGSQSLTSGDGGINWTLGNISGLTSAAGAYSLTLTAAGSGIGDSAGNALAAGATTSWTVDVTAPTVAITPVAPDPRNTQVGSIAIAFSEAVTGFDLADLALTRDGGGNLLTGSQTLTSGDGGVNWTLGNLSGLTGAAGSFALTLTASGSEITDSAGNALASGASDSWVVDLTAPTVTITPVAPDPRSTPVASIAIGFSEAVTGFDLSDLSLTRNGGNLLTGSQTLTSGDGGVHWTLGSLSALTGPTGSYTLTLTPSSDGITDSAGNALAVGASESFDVVLPQWRGPGGGSFNSSADWSDGTVPNAPDAVARFLSGTFGNTAAAVVTVNSPVTLGTLTIDSPNSYTLTGASAITFAGTGPLGLNVVHGSHTIVGTVFLGGVATIGNGASLTISGIVANQLVIGAGSTVTIAASDDGGSMASASSAALAAPMIGEAVGVSEASAESFTTTTAIAAPALSNVAAPIGPPTSAHVGQPLSVVIASVPSTAPVWAQLPPKSTSNVATSGARPLPPLRAAVVDRLLVEVEHHRFAGVRPVARRGDVALAIDPRDRAILDLLK